MELLREAGPLLISWFDANKRSMPWRDEPTPYHVLVSEIMLQQTRVDTVIPYYRRFTEELPDLQALSEADPERLMKLWEGLGYYSRATNLKKAAKVCMERYGGALPQELRELLSLPGIGSYTAGAVLSIAYGKAYPAVDGNVLRVMMRLAGSFEDISDPKNRKKLEELLQRYLTESGIDPSRFNQGLMELGALICLPNAAPKCTACPLRSCCEAFKKGLTDQLPVKSPGKERKRVDKTVLFVCRGSELLLGKPRESGLLAGLAVLPELPGFCDEKAVSAYLEGLGLCVIRQMPLGRKKHVFTHLEWHMDGVRAEVTGALTADAVSEGLRFLDAANERYAFPKAYKKWDL